MAKVTKSLSARVNKETGKSEIHFRFIANKETSIRAKSNIFISPAQWNEKKGELKTSTFGQQQLEAKTSLEKLCSLIIEEFTKTKIQDVNKEWLNNIIQEFHNPTQPTEPTQAEEPEQTQLCTWEIINKFIESYKVRNLYLTHYNVLLRILKRYELYRQKKNKNYSFNIHTLTKEELDTLKDYFINEYIYLEKHPNILKAVPESRPPKERGYNTIQATYKRMRTLFIWCNKNELTTNNPFKNYKIAENIYGTPYYITIEERNTIYKTQLKTKEQEIQRDIFVFQCLIGCRVSDLLKLTKNSVINGNVEYIQEKTKEDNPITIKVPLNSIALEITERYKHIEGNKLLPFISSTKYNIHIKTIFTDAGITRLVTILNPTTGKEEKRPLNEIASSHLARRTFVGNLYKQVKDPNLVGALSGHKEGSKAFSRYREIDDEIKKDLVKLLE